MSDWRIPFNSPTRTGRELEYLEAALAADHISGDGEFTARCERFLEEEIGAPRVLLTPSCTQALELAGLLLGIEHGDEVIVPSFTFASTAGAFALHGARIVFADVRRDTLNLDEDQLETLITPKTKAIVVVHYAGVACEMDAIRAIAERHGVAVIEDNAHGLFGRYRGRPLGSLGTFAAQSFHETKNVTCGEGGALVLNDQRYADRAEILREKGTNRKNFFRGQVDKYTWVDIGSSFLTSDLSAAFLASQFESAAEIQHRRRRVFELYAEGLAAWATALGAQLPHVPSHCEQSYHMFYVLLPTEELRDGLIARLRELGILAVFHYLPLHLSPEGRRHAPTAPCPVTEDVSGRLVRLPFYTSLTEADQNAVLDAVRSFPA